MMPHRKAWSPRVAIVPAQAPARISISRPRSGPVAAAGCVPAPRRSGEAISRSCSQRSSCLRPSTVTAWRSDSMRRPEADADELTRRSRFNCQARPALEAFQFGEFASRDEVDQADDAELQAESRRPRRRSASRSSSPEAVEAERRLQCAICPRASRPFGQQFERQPRQPRPASAGSLSPTAMRSILTMPTSGSSAQRRCRARCSGDSASV